MTTQVAVAPAIDPKEQALWKAVGLDAAKPEQRELAINIAARYDLDLLLKHLVLIEGRPYITRDGLIHVAHRSGVFDGIETTEPTLSEDGFWRSTCSVYRKDMSRPFTYTGRYPRAGQNTRFAPEMAVKVGEVMALRRAFDVAAPAAEERWDVDDPRLLEPTHPEPPLRERVIAGAQEAPSGEPDAPVPPSDSAPGSPEPPEAAPGAPEKAGEPISAPEMGMTADEFKSSCRERGYMQGMIRRVGSGLYPGRIEKASDIESLTDQERSTLFDALIDEANTF